MAKSEKLPEGVIMLVQRHAAVAGTETGLNAINSMKKISNVDPSEGVWQKGDEFEVAPADQIAEAAFVAMVNGNKAPAIAVHCTNGQDKVLYLSTLKKNVVVYHETEDGYETVKNADGTAETHFADTPLRKEVMSKATVGDIVTSLAGRKFKVADVLGPYKTSRLKAVYGDNGQRTGYEVVGLRNTSIPVFEEVK
jgi:hypothetical protein